MGSEMCIRDRGDDFFLKHTVDRADLVSESKVFIKDKTKVARGVVTQVSRCLFRPIVVGVQLDEILFWGSWEFRVIQVPTSSVAS